MEQGLLNPGPLSAQRAPTDDQKLIKLLREKLQNYEKEVDESRANVDRLKENLLLEQERREKAEMKLSKLQDTETKSHILELELVSCGALFSNKLRESPYGNGPQKQTLTNWNDTGEVASRWKELGVGVESANLKLAAVIDERDKLLKEHTMLSKQKPASLEDMRSTLSGMEKIIRELESTIDELSEKICHQHAEFIRVNERLSIEVGKVKSLVVQEGEQLRFQVASLESKVGPPDYAASSTEICHIEEKQTVGTPQSGSKKTRERLQEVVGLKVQPGSVKKQPVVIEISDDENTSPWNDNGNKRSLKSDPSCSGKLGPGFIKENYAIEIDDDKYCTWSYDERKHSLKISPLLQWRTGFCKERASCH